MRVNVKVQPFSTFFWRHNFKRFGQRLFKSLSFYNQHMPLTLAYTLWHITYFTYPRLNLYLELLLVIGFQRFIAEYGKYLSKGHVAQVLQRNYFYILFFIYAFKSNLQSAHFIFYKLTLRIWKCCKFKLLKSQYTPSPPPQGYFGQLGDVSWKRVPTIFLFFILKFVKLLQKVI